MSMCVCVFYIQEHTQFIAPISVMHKINFITTFIVDVIDLTSFQVNFLQYLHVKTIFYGVEFVLDKCHNIIKL